MGAGNGNYHSGISAVGSFSADWLTIRLATTSVGLQSAPTQSSRGFLHDPHTTSSTSTRRRLTHGVEITLTPVSAKNKKSHLGVHRKMPLQEVVHPSKHVNRAAQLFPLPLQHPAEVHRHPVSLRHEHLLHDKYVKNKTKQNKRWRVQRRHIVRCCTPSKITNAPGGGIFMYFVCDLAKGYRHQAQKIWNHTAHKAGAKAPFRNEKNTISVRLLPKRGLG